ARPVKPPPTRVTSAVCEMPTDALGAGAALTVTEPALGMLFGVDHRAARHCGPVLIEAQVLLDDVKRSILDLVIDATDVLTQYSHAKQLNTADEQNGDHQGGPSLDPCVGEEAQEQRVKNSEERNGRADHSHRSRQLQRRRRE